MSLSSKPPRLHLLPAKEAPRCIVVARVKSQVWHILDWNLQTGGLQGGSWFRGNFYPLRSDVSWDGEYMVYLATNYTRPLDENAWTGLCKPPRLKTVAYADNPGSYNGGGVFTEKGTLAWNHPWGMPFVTEPEQIPFQQRQLGADVGEDPTGIFPRLIRDEWIWNASDKVWRRRPSKDHPELRAHYMGYIPDDSNKRAELGGRRGYAFKFSLEDRPNLLTGETEWATWDANGDLLWAEHGWLYRAHPKDLRQGKGAFQRINLTGLEPPKREG